MSALAELWAKHIMKGNKSESQLMIFPEEFQNLVKDIVAEKETEKADQEAEEE
ncbi:hypothetical protein [Marinilactibacillus psychrotolerans]|uniref:hypothetical protein n=1 Tax=Marinilactibacillus psychrotolerans TaxID=191770 RepID=UPI0014870311|nr:hypothetical protein [Marinilactibacillus psychrotolerans]